LRDTLREEISDVLRELGITAVYVTHDQGEAMGPADRLVVMSNGRIEQIGAPTVSYEHPANRFVASFVGETNALPENPQTLFRPEAVSIIEPTMPGSRIAMITSVTYPGASRRVLLDLEGQPIIAYVEGLRQLVPGDQVGVTLDTKRFMQWESS